MKRLALFLSIFILTSAACLLDFSPPPLSFTPAPAQASDTPAIVLATPQPTLPPVDSAPLPTQTPGVPTVTETSTPVVPEAGKPVLSEAQLRNATLIITGSDLIKRTITLRDGKYQEVSDPAKPETVSITAGDKIAFGDINGDGLEDAAMTIAENYGGTGQFVSVIAVINRDGLPDVIDSALIDDRPILNNLAIRNGEIVVDATIHGINDPMCCATLESSRSYRLIEDTLILARYSSRVPSGIERIIQIDSPINGDEISGTFVVKGSVTVSPFENNLTYTVFVPGTQTTIAEAGFMVSGDGLGGPGTFELPLNLSPLHQGPIAIKIADISAADGSVQALSTIFIVIH